MLAGQLPRRPVGDDVREVAPPHRHVTEDALHSLAVAGCARRAQQRALHRLPRDSHRLAPDDIQAQVVLTRERNAVLDPAPAERTYCSPTCSSAASAVATFPIATPSQRW